MSKNYNKFYKQHEDSVNEEVKEVQTTEEAVEVIQEETPAEEPKVEEPVKETFKTLNPLAKVVGGRPVNMRYKPNKSGQVINIIPCGAKVVIENEAGEWWKCSYKGITGYMMSQFLKKE